MPEFRISTEELIDRNMCLTQYLIMWGLYYERAIRGLLVTDEIYETLLKREFIVPIGSKYSLTDKGRAVFETVSNEDDIFDEFLEVFPTRVTDATGLTRTLSPASSSSILGRKMKVKWRTITKNKLEIQKHIIACLQAEVNMRKSTGALYWMRNMEAWLNKGTWQDYEYLLTDTLRDNSVSTRRVGEIEL
jgi:hypothetical protein